MAKFPPIIEDLSFTVGSDVETQVLIDEIKKQSELITNVDLLDQHEKSRTFHINYQHPERNLTNEEISEIRKKIISTLQKKFGASIR